MGLQQEQIREEQKQRWNDVSQGWIKWGQFIREFLRPTGEVIIERLEIKEDDIVLDVAAGTGEPGLTIAAIVKKGSVTGTDLSDDMLQIAEANADAKGLKNYSTKPADVCKLPFEDNTFNKISCRMGFMFFPDLQLATNELYRVLKPGGCLAISVWSAPDKNFWYTVVLDAIDKHIKLPPSSPDVPGMFRCSQPDLMTNIFEQAGFKHVGVQELVDKVDFVDADTYWQNRVDISESVIAALKKADAATIAAIKNEVYANVNANSINGRALLEYGADIIYGEK
ncbi:MAG TPA: methyltransferase domain-containing protein [Mucilaginibacter sp.]